MALSATILTTSILAPIGAVLATHKHPSPHDNSNKPTVNLIERGPATSASGNTKPADGSSSNNSPPISAANGDNNAVTVSPSNNNPSTNTNNPPQLPSNYPPAIKTITLPNYQTVNLTSLGGY